MRRSGQTQITIRTCRWCSSTSPQISTNNCKRPRRCRTSTAQVVRPGTLTTAGTKSSTPTSGPGLRRTAAGLRMHTTRPTSTRATGSGGSSLLTSSAPTTQVAPWPRKRIVRFQASTIRRSSSRASSQPLLSTQHIPYSCRPRLLRETDGATSCSRPVATKLALVGISRSASGRRTSPDRTSCGGKCVTSERKRSPRT